ncbi:unnamed protein product, partial [Choristocarpus tenellus]
AGRFAEWGTAFALENLAHSLHNDLFPKVLEELKGLYSACPKASAAFLDAEIRSGMKGMKELLLTCPDRHVRHSMVGFYLHLLGLLAEDEGDWYLEYQLVEENEGQALGSVSQAPGPAATTTAALSGPMAARGASRREALSVDTNKGSQDIGAVLQALASAHPLDASNSEHQLHPGFATRQGGGGGLGVHAYVSGKRFLRPRTRLPKMVDGWVGLLPEAARGWGRLEQFLEFVEGVGNMGDRERDLLLERHMVGKLIDFFLQ